MTPTLSDWELRPVEAYELRRKGDRRGVLFQTGRVGEAMDHTIEALTGEGGGDVYVLNKSGKVVTKLSLRPKAASS